MTTSLAHNASQKAEQWEERAAAAENKLVQMLPEDQLMKLIFPEDSAYNFEAGTIIVNIRIFPTRDLKIYETVSAMVDGSLKAQILGGTEVVDNAYLPLPWNGSETSTTFKGVCRNLARQAKKCTVKVQPYHLRAMEK